MPSICTREEVITMDTSIIVNIILCILSFILAAVSVITVVITLKQNSKMIENSTRPYIVVYLGMTNFQNPNYYLCIKNFGQSSAIITSFSCDCDLAEYSRIHSKIPFKHICPSSIAPGQLFKSTLDSKKLFNGTKKTMTFSIEYTFARNTYKDIYTINLEADSDMVHTRANTDGKELKIISYALQDISENLL